MKKLGLFLALALTACTDGGTTYNGHSTYEYFPFEGERTWTYVADTDAVSPNVDYNLFVDKAGSRMDGTTEIVLLEYRKNDESGDLLYSIEWSSDNANGVRVWSYEVQGGDSVTFDDPILFSSYQMVVGDEVTSSSNGIEITSTLAGLEDCPNYWTDNVWTCLHFTVEGAEVPFAGDWWGAGSWGASRFQNPYVDQEWVLASGYWSGSSEAE